jgi:peptide/nickel transport system permease protein
MRHKPSGTIRPTHWTTYLLATLLAGMGVGLVLLAFGRWIRPDTSRVPWQYSAEEIKAADAVRDVSFTPDDLYSLHVDVPPIAPLSSDRPAWYPRGEAPILHELVTAGKLPTVAERVGSEPIVLRGVDGIGRYGGTWLRLANAPADVGIITWRLSGAGMVRFSPLGYPIKPHLAKSVTSADGGKTWIVRLRQGIRWSDGHPLTADDIMYWWTHEINDKAVNGTVPLWLLARGKAATIEKVDHYAIRIRYPVPNGLFLERLAFDSQFDFAVPAHYLRPFHPTLGDQALIKEKLAAYAAASPKALYTLLKGWQNPAHPRLWPWIYRQYSATPPFVFVRNPYYYVVDERGNQLPYIDRLQVEVQDQKMIPISAANGLASMQDRHLFFDQYAELMSRRKRSGTRVLCWYPGTRSIFTINPNLNRLVDPKRPETGWKAGLLAEKRFRQALSLAINRQAIIRAEFANQGVPSQVEPGPESPFHSPGLATAFTAYDPARANGLLDALWRDLEGDPTVRDSEGFRVFPDGRRMVLFLDQTSFTPMGPGQFITDDWKAIGLRVLPRERARTLFYTEKDAGDFDLNVWTSESDFLPLASPRLFIPNSGESFYAAKWGRWFAQGGFFGLEQATRSQLSQPVPTAHPMYRAMSIYQRALQAPTLAEQRRIFEDVLAIAAENVWTISLATAPPQPVVVNEHLRNVPSLAVLSMITSTPANTGIETYYFTESNDSAGAVAATQTALLKADTLPPVNPPAVVTESPLTVGTRWAFMLIGLALLVLLCSRHPFVGQRLLIMIPTLLVISICTFAIIQLPPGDFLTARIVQLQAAGDNAQAELQQLADLEKLFHFDEPQWKRYLRWMGAYWYQTHDPADAGLLQGNMGLSMETMQPVNAVVGDRMLLTVLVSLGTILLTWLLAVPIGIYSAVRQHSAGDYAVTLIGFLGMCIPPFLLALILMTMADVSGLFSPEFATQPEWTWAKTVDLLRHIWIPVVVMAVGGTAGMIRVMRANLLDELKKPYVVTARAKGLSPLRLLLKYPVRLALNPFISSIGGLFPQLVSGGAIVGIVLSLPLVGPLMLSALFAQDMNLAGSMLMLLSLLSVLGTLISDLLLLWLDPRIRFEAGTR